MDIGISKNGVPIRLTSERWQHITSGHPEIADYYYEILDAIENPDTVLDKAMKKYGEHKTEEEVIAMINKDIEEFLKTG